MTRTSGENFQSLGFGRRVAIGTVDDDDIIGRLDRAWTFAAGPQPGFRNGHRPLDPDLLPGRIDLEIGAELDLQIGGFQRLEILALNRQLQLRLQRIDGSAELQLAGIGADRAGETQRSLAVAGGGELEVFQLDPGFGNAGAGVFQPDVAAQRQLGNRSGDVDIRPQLSRDLLQLRYEHGDHLQIGDGRIDFAVQPGGAEWVLGLQVGLQLPGLRQIQPHLAAGGTAVGLQLHAAAVESEANRLAIGFHAQAAGSDVEVGLALDRATDPAAGGGFAADAGGERHPFG